MTYHNWLRPFAKALAIFGILIIVIGVLAYQKFPPFEAFSSINCELGYLGLFLFITGLAIRTKKLQQPSVNQSQS